MKIRIAWTVAACATFLAMLSKDAVAQESECARTISRTNIVQCAEAASLAVKSERALLSAGEGRREAVSPLLPSNPVLSLSGDRRTNPADDVRYNWYVTLSQELEIAGQRGVRRDAVDAELEAQSKRVVLSRRDTAALAWVAYFDAVAAADEQRLAARLTVSAQTIAAVAAARSEKGLIAPIDSDVADAASIRILQTKLEADRQVADANAVVASMLGLDPSKPTPAIVGDLVPIGVTQAADIQKIAGAHPEVLALDAERRALALRADAFRRARIPNPTLSVFAQNDGIDEHVFGVGVAIPIPIPGNVGRTYRGEIAEAEALSQRATIERDRATREIRLEIAVAIQTFDARAKETEAFSPERISRAETSLASIAQEVESGRLAVRDAVVAQQALIDLLRSNVEARREWCLASVKLAKALNVPLEGGAS